MYLKMLTERRLKSIRNVFFQLSKYKKGVNAPEVYAVSVFLFIRNVFPYLFNTRLQSGNSFRKSELISIKISPPRKSGYMAV